MQNKSENSSPLSTDEVVARIADALGPEWMALMEVQPETIRTWRKRGEVPVKQLLRAAQRSGRTVEYFNSVHSSASGTDVAASAITCT